MVNSRAKGARGELEWAKVCRDHGYTEARRGQQYCGSNGDADVVGIPGIHCEVKRVEKLNIHQAMHQAVSDAHDGETPVVCHRKDRTGWLVTMRAGDWFEMVNANAVSEAGFNALIEAFEESERLRAEDEART